MLNISFADFKNDFLKDLKEEFLCGRSDELLKDYNIEKQFEEFCKGQYDYYVKFWELEND